MVQRKKRVRVQDPVSGMPPRIVENFYYFAILYGIMDEVLHISVIPLMGIGMHAVLASYCLLHRNARPSNLYPQLMYPLSCVVSYLAVQLLINDESLMGDYTKPFVYWSFTLIIIQALALRPGFLRRFSIATFVIGLTTLPYIQLDTSISDDRAALANSISIANANEFGAWFGYCAIFFMIAGIEAKRQYIRIISWLTMIGCLGIVGLTVSRTALLAFSFAAVLALRRFLKSGFLPLLLFVAVGWIAYESGVFEHAVSSYEQRGMEETGRLLVWPEVIKRFLESPLIGVGASNVGTYAPGKIKPITPHNAFLFIGLAGGIVPLALFVAYWWQAGWASIRCSTKRTIEAPFYIPLFSYSFLVVQSGNLTFLTPWVITTLATAVSAGVVGRASPYIGHRTKASKKRKRWYPPVEPESLS